MDRDPRRPTPGPVVRQPGDILTGRLAGDWRIRRPRRSASETIPLRPQILRRRRRNPALVFVSGFAGAILIGTILLMLPLSSVDGRWTPFLIALFTSTSAVCVTGLVVVDTATYWSFFGQGVILALIQIGGFGFMTSSTLLLLLIGRRATLRERVLLKEALGSGELGSVRRLAGKVILFTFVVEAVGAAILTARFAVELDPSRAIWWGVFHSISAFNNAGFDLTGDFLSLIPFSDDPVVLLTVAALLIVGGISYTVVEDLIKRRRLVRLTLDTKLVLAATACLIPLGTIGILMTEWSNPQTLGAMDPGMRILNGFFQGVAPRTAGFASVNIGAMTEPGLLVVIALMFVGGASGSTAGGIKIQIFTLLFFVIVSAVRGLHTVEAFQRQVPIGEVLRAVAVVLLSLGLIFVVAFMLNAGESAAFLGVLFEAFSAFGTVGLSTGITPDLSPLGLVLLIVTMFAGRLGPLTLVVALAARERRTTYQWPEEGIKIG